MSNIPKFNFNPSPDFTETLKVGDKVFFILGSNFRRHKDFNDLEVATVTRLTPKFVVIPHPRLDGDEMRFKKVDRLQFVSGFKHPSEIYPYNAETLAVYTELKRRAEIVDSIECATSWNLLPTETLEAIAGLMDTRKT